MLKGRAFSAFTLSLPALYTDYQSVGVPEIGFSMNLDKNKGTFHYHLGKTITFASLIFEKPQEVEQT